MDCQPSFLNVERPIIFICCSAEAKFSALNLLEFVFHGKLGFSRQDFDGNKTAKGKYLARKARDKEVFI